MPSILSQMGPQSLKAMLDSVSKGKGGMGGLEAMLGGMGLGGGAPGAGGEEGDMPALESDFEAVSQQ
jgi:hypothetical protein